MLARIQPCPDPGITLKYDEFIARSTAGGHERSLSCARTERRDGAEIDIQFKAFPCISHWFDAVAIAAAWHLGYMYLHKFAGPQATGHLVLRTVSIRSLQLRKGRLGGHVRPRRSWPPQRPRTRMEIGLGSPVEVSERQAPPCRFPPPGLRPPDAARAWTKGNLSNFKADEKNRSQKRVCNRIGCRLSPDRGRRRSRCADG
jgi:hypothetical protein